MAGSTELQSPYLATGTLPSHARDEDGGTSFKHVNGNVTIHQGQSPVALWPVRSAYTQQVKRIAPPELLGRDAELAELASFCLEDSRGPYVWWQAGPWAGKSALLSTFVLHPPAPLEAVRVRLVSFFITARLAAQDTRDAFTTVLMEQLCALLGSELPVVVNEATRDAVLLDLLEQAAIACQQADERLVLVVDGLDEDRGETTGPKAQSIAGLLPGDPPAGMRIIVAGRPNPPVPDDVPDWHPLRDPGIVRLLSGSPHAENLERLGQSELKRLLAGSPIEQDLLGLLTAARGGLSGPDLRDLTGTDLVTVEEILHTVVGRTFTRRIADWTPEDGQQFYLLGHEELHNAACHYLGRDRLADHRNRLHDWADSYRKPSDGQLSWPAHTPQYLLTGYPRMLATEADTDRLVNLAIDPARHDRMLDLSGGDTAALTEIRTCQDLLLRRPEPDLYAMARLSHHRAQLQSRNDNIPAGLPAVWVTLDQPHRAEALARAITSPSRQVLALSEVARRMTASDRHKQAREVAFLAEQSAQSISDRKDRPLSEVAITMAIVGEYGRAEQIAQKIADTTLRARTLARMTQTAAATGQFEWAEHTARAIANPHQREQALASLAEQLAANGQRVRAERLIEEITAPDILAQALTTLVQAAATTGEEEGTRRLIVYAERTAQDITNPDQQARALTALVKAAANAGQHERARELATHTEQTAHTITNPGRRTQALLDLAQATATAGGHDQAHRLIVYAERTAQDITNPDQQARALTALVKAAANAGQHERARELATHTEQTAHTITNPDRQAWILTELAETAVAFGDPERAQHITEAIGDANRRAQALTALARSATEAGQREWARELTIHAERTAQAITNSHRQAWSLADLAIAVTATGRLEKAERIAQSINEPDQQTRALTILAESATSGGTYEWARRLTIQAEQTVQSIVDPNHAARALLDIAKAASNAGEHEQAQRLITQAIETAQAIIHPQHGADTLLRLVQAAIATGELERAEHITQTINSPEQKAQALLRLVQAAIATGELERAEHITQTINKIIPKVKRLINRLQTATTAGELERTDKVVQAVANPRQRTQAALFLAEKGTNSMELAGSLCDTQRMAASPVSWRRLLALINLAQAASDVGEYEQARTLSAEAEQAAGAIRNSGQRTQALTALAKTLIITGSLEQVERIIQVISNPYQQAWALTEVAKAADPLTARHLLNRALAIGWWLTPMPVLAILSPMDVIRIADAVHPASPEPFSITRPSPQ